MRSGRSTKQLLELVPKAVQKYKEAEGMNELLMDAYPRSVGHKIIANQHALSPLWGRNLKRSAAALGQMEAFTAELKARGISHSVEMN